MGKLLWGGLIVAMACGGLAHAADGGNSGSKFARWDAVEDLLPGTEIDVLSSGQAGPDVCLVSAVDDKMLTCLAEYSASDVRLVFPRGAVRDVWVMELAPARHIGLWIAMGVGFFLGGAMCAEMGPGMFFACGAIGASIFAGSAMTGPGAMGPWAGMRPPPPPRLRRRLIYRLPQAARAGYP